MRLTICPIARLSLPFICSPTILLAFNDNPEVGTVGLDQKYTRLTFVCYLREKIAECPDKIDPQFLKESGHAKIIMDNNYE